MKRSDKIFRKNHKKSIEEMALKKSWLMNHGSTFLAEALNVAGFRPGSSRLTKGLMCDILVRCGNIKSATNLAKLSMNCKPFEIFESLDQFPQ